PRFCLRGRARPPRRYFLLQPHGDFHCRPCLIPRRVAMLTLFRNLNSRLAEKRFARLVRRNTMLPPARLSSLASLAQRLEDERIPGDVVECGVYRGGSAALLAHTVTHSHFPRTLWLFDVFSGMPPASAA